MFGINKLLKREPLTEDERFEIIKKKQIDVNVVEYVKNRLLNLTIEIGGKRSGKALELMKKGLLEGWCWQTTETAIVFFNDSDYITRGNLTFSPHKKYYHSWICFNFECEEYVFDPCLDLLCKKKLYDKIFEIEIMGKVSAKQVREELLSCIANHKPREESIFDKFLDEKTLKRQKDETHICGDNNVYSPMYRNNTGYILETKNGKIKRLVAHYYFNA